MQSINYKYLSRSMSIYKVKIIKTRQEKGKNKKCRLLNGLDGNRKKQIYQLQVYVHSSFYIFK